MRTVSNEMSDEERRERLLKGLKATSAEEVACDVSHLIQAIGEAAAEKCVLSLAETQELVQGNFTRTPKIRKTGICSVNRQEVIDIIESMTEPPQEDDVPQHFGG